MKTFAELKQDLIARHPQYNVGQVIDEVEKYFNPPSTGNQQAVWIYKGNEGIGDVWVYGEELTNNRHNLLHTTIIKY